MAGPDVRRDACDSYLRAHRDCLRARTHEHGGRPHGMFSHPDCIETKRQQLEA